MHVGSPDNPDVVDDLIGGFLQALLYAMGNGQHGRGTERIPGVNAQRVDIFNETDGDHLPFGIPYHFQFQFFPAQKGLFHQHLTHQAGLDTPLANLFQFVRCIHKATPDTAHGIGGAQNHGITQLVCNRQSIFHAISHFTARHCNAQAVHGFLECNPVFAPFDGIDFDTDHFDAVFV